MAWEKAKWACGHEGAVQLFGPQRDRDRRLAQEAGRQCMACWLVGQWATKNDPRAAREDRWDLACDIAEGKGIRISGGEPDNMPGGPLAGVSDADLLAECRRRRLIT